MPAGAHVRAGSVSHLTGRVRLTGRVDAVRKEGDEIGQALHAAKDAYGMAGRREDSAEEGIDPGTVAIKAPMLAAIGGEGGSDVTAS